MRNRPILSREAPPVIRPGFPRAGSLSGTQKRREFIAGLLSLSLDTRQLMVPLLTDTVSSTSVDDNGRTITWDATIASRFITQGSGSFISFDGATNYGTSPDAANMSFGDGTLGEPFSIYQWLSLTADANVKAILARHDLTTGVTNLEWSFHLDASEKLVGQVFDDSEGTDVRVGRTFNTALAASTPMLVVMIYSGGATNGSVKLYVFDGTNAGQVDDTDAGSGVFIAMENKAGLTYIGAREAASGAATNFFNGALGAGGLVKGELDANQLQVLRQLGNGYYDLKV